MTHYLVKAYVLLMYGLFALATLDMIVAYTPFETFYDYVHHTGSVVLVIWVVVSLVAFGWGVWKYVTRT